MQKSIKLITDFYFYDNKLKRTITFPKDTIMGEDNPYFKEIYNKSKDYYIEIKTEVAKNFIHIEEKEEIKPIIQEEKIVVQELKEEVKSIKKKKNRFFKNEE
jgi:hypothetical protein